MQISALRINDHQLNWGERTYLMGTLNITPDSFSGDGLIKLVNKTNLKSKPGQLNGSDLLLTAVLEQARRFISAGADILDVGGESTRPGSKPVDVEEEIRRVIPAIQAIASEFEVLISVDTYKAQVARAALEAGAHMVNDIWAFRADPNLAPLVASFGVPIILMHNRSSWMHAEIKDNLGGRYVGVEYQNLLEDIKRELLESVAMANNAGIPDERIILDPGIGFGKTVEQNLELLDKLEEIRAIGFPVLIGPSRKSFIGYTLNLPPDQRVEGTAAAVAIGIARGADIVRVHDVEYMARIVRMTDAIVRGQSAREISQPGKST
jgi:dihydropteroate synthase